MIIAEKKSGLVAAVGIPDRGIHRANANVEPRLKPYVPSFHLFPRIVHNDIGNYLKMQKKKKCP